MIRTTYVLAGLMVAACTATSAQAQSNYPTRNITLVLPFAAGSGTDTTTRIISKELGVALNTGMIVDNKSGANGSIAASFVRVHQPMAIRCSSRRTRRIPPTPICSRS
jgi:tripartite-type tricarboxylate transporter receptor subunit TctC